MKRNVQILLLIACMVPLLVQAKEETMEERKRRITRKYLRERTDMTYSDEVVPGDDVAAEEALADEKLNQADMEIERHEPGSRPPPPVWQPAPRTQNRNWLLSEPEEPADPYADPFAQEDPEDEPKNEAWTTWGTERESRYNESGYDSYYGEQPGSYDSTKQGWTSDPRTSFGEDMQSGFSQQRGQTFGSSEWLDQSRGNTYNSIFNQNRVQNPVPSGTETPVNPLYDSEWQPRTGTYTPYKSPYQMQREKQQEQRGGYTPYKSPYQTRRENQQKQWGGYSAPEQEYQRKDLFQQWKTKNAAPYDPMSEDAFIQKTMPNPRR